MAYASIQGPGKTSPRINQDLLNFDPLKVKQSFNILTEAAPVLGDANFLTSNNDACKHDYTTKASQSQPPPFDQRPDGSTFHKLAIVCKHCRIHADVLLDYRDCTDPCPTSTHPLHHFRRVPALDEAHNTHLNYGWQCSSPSCSATLNIKFKVQRLHKQHVLSLTDTSQLKKRYEDILRIEPEREGIKQATPVEALTRLRKYIKDSLNPEHNKRTFPANNKRFMEAFGYYGADCRPVLEDLGFEYSETDITWTLPNPAPYVAGQDADSRKHREYLEDVELELVALMGKYSKDMNLANPAADEPWHTANRDLERTLASQGYPRTTITRRLTPNLEAYTASLGALPDFADSLIEFCYDRQTMCDPEQQPYYFECLREIAQFRNTEALTMKVAVLESQGCITRHDLREAYSFFGLSQGGGGADDDRILNLYQAQQPDLSAEAAEKSRVMLGRIGTARGSQVLMNASTQSIETVEEALAWLGNGVGKETSDDMLTTVFAIKTEGDPAKEEIGRKAIAVIAKARESNELKTWLETGRMDGYTMSIDEALRHVDITDSFDSVEATLWPTIFDNARQTRPGVQTERAITSIQQALSGQQPSHVAADWPVGLTSLGNTCYLNSLLQYYFSIKPLRDIVLEYDKFKFDLSTASEKTERVGQRQISLLEIKGGQKFAEDLKHLFERMIKDPSSAVKPEQDLVCRAFLDPKDSDLWDNKDKAEVEHAVEETVPVAASSVVAEPDSITKSEVQEDIMEITESQDVKMTDMPLTPPASPQPKPETNTVQGDAPKAPPLPPRRFSTTTNAALERAQSNATQQQDVTEVHDGIQFRLRAGLHSKGHDASGEQLDELLELFSIGLLDTPVKDGQQLKSQLIRDSAIQLNVPTEPTDLYTALDAVFDQQPLDGGHMEQYKSIISAPPFLQVNIPRVGFNKEKAEQYKSEHSIKLPDELYLDRYMAKDDSDILDRRRNAWNWRRKLTELKKGQTAQRDVVSGLDGPTAVAESAKYIQQMDSANAGLEELGIGAVEFEKALPEVLHNSAGQQAVHLRKVEEEAASLEQSLNGLFEELKTMKYRLQAVFFHRGRTAHGHYWICIRDFSTETWRRYNDERVEKVAPEKLNEIFEANDWSHGTPTYAVYVRDDIKTAVVQPVCRQPEQPQTVETPQEQQSGQPRMPSDDVPSAPAAEHAQASHSEGFVIEGGHEDWDKPRSVAAGPW
ncbi:hypothetical protein AMS68_005658 [Peltaster fructicola]|uniref:ubiquitinyl hydrolase 1 n=1 Tax=Peltaster fructicola TaxID=286661 RepID=A0A6H0XZP8_9PEZI|nr:hypothetical protein AMS68_005658 [Peltaster fructicola]